MGRRATVFSQRRAQAPHRARQQPPPHCRSHPSITHATCCAPPTPARPPGVLKYKGMAEEELRRSGLPYTILRPGRLTDGALAGRMHTRGWVQRRRRHRDGVAGGGRTPGCAGHGAALRACGGAGQGTQNLPPLPPPPPLSSPGPYTSYDINTLLRNTSGARQDVQLSMRDDLMGEASRIAVAEAILQARTRTGLGWGGSHGGAGAGRLACAPPSTTLPDPSNACTQPPCRRCSWSAQRARPLPSAAARALGRSATPQSGARCSRAYCPRAWRERSGLAPSAPARPSRQPAPRQRRPLTCHACCRPPSPSSSPPCSPASSAAISTSAMGACAPLPSSRSSDRRENPTGVGSYCSERRYTSSRARPCTLRAWHTCPRALEGGGGEEGG